MAVDLYILEWVEHEEIRNQREANHVFGFARIVVHYLLQHGVNQTYVWFGVSTSASAYPGWVWEKTSGLLAKAFASLTPAKMLHESWTGWPRSLGDGRAPGRIMLVPAADDE